MEMIGTEMGWRNGVAWACMALKDLRIGLGLGFEKEEEKMGRLREEQREKDQLSVCKTGITLFWK
jgi:hypothetical protein